MGRHVKLMREFRAKIIENMHKLLVVFDFDHTIIDSNSDIVVRKLVPQHLIPDEVKKLYKTDGWTVYMQEIFKILQTQKVTKDEIIKTCKNFEPTDGMVNLIAELKKSLSADVIIISDSNSVFIEEWLKAKNLSKYVDRVFTNPAQFTKDGLLEIKMYHEQDWCKLSTKNLCKGHILESFIKERVVTRGNYSVVAYVGDGKNDLCPTLKLRSVDHCFPRIGYHLLASIHECNATKSHFIQAQVHPWKTGDDILKVLKQICE